MKKSSALVEALLSEEGHTGPLAPAPATKYPDPAASPGRRREVTVTELIENLLKAGKPLIEMLNSYTTAFGDVPKGYEPSSEVEDLAIELMNGFVDSVDVRENTITFMKAVKASGVQLDKAAKAYILDQCFHNANENFYEYMEDPEGAQDEFLEAVKAALSEQPLEFPPKDPVNPGRRRVQDLIREYWLSNEQPWGTETPAFNALMRDTGMPADSLVRMLTDMNGK